MSSGRVTALYRYPVKGMAAEPLKRVSLSPGATLPFDRAFAIENGPGKFDPAAPRHLPKVNFVMLMRDERLASLDSRFEEATQTLTLAPRGGGEAVSGRLDTTDGRAAVEAFIARFMQGLLRGAPRIVSAEGHSFSDVKAKCLHIVNLASLRDLERAAGGRLDPLRFRPNVVVDDLPSWSEFELLDKRFRLGGAWLTAFARTDRCAAVNVDPATGKRAGDLPGVLERTWGHDAFGIYATVDEGGTLSVGDDLAADG